MNQTLESAPIGEVVYVVSWAFNWDGESYKLISHHNYRLDPFGTMYVPIRRTGATTFQICLKSLEIRHLKRLHYLKSDHPENVYNLALVPNVKAL